jgi:hypothetical protein
VTATTKDVPAGGFRYIPGVFQYSGGVAALDGFRIERVEFLHPVALAQGFAFISAPKVSPSRASALASCARLRPSPRRASPPSTTTMSARSSAGA